MLYNRCKGIHKFGNKYLTSAYKMQVEFRSHFSEKKVHLMVREIRYLTEMCFVKVTRQGSVLCSVIHMQPKLCDYSKP